jgi:hypothetical protein
MSRVFVPISANDLKGKVLACCGEDGEIDYRNLTSVVSKDLDKVKFDCENISDDGYKFGPEVLLGYNKLPNGMSYYGVAAGGDWETPVFFCIYWDGKKLRGYIPEKGNLWNTDTKEAYGNNDKADLKNARKLWPDNKDLKNDDVDLEGYFDSYDVEEIKKDIMGRITLKGAPPPPKPEHKNVKLLSSFTDDELLEELKRRANLPTKK